jgi:cation diffusion facilitator CzcD-associated flavoprotein CzcO
MIAANNSFDVIVIGAGISGINAAYRLQEGIPDYSYAILEGRGEIGGTWSLFKYPGIRSDSDLHTFGFPWDPWKEDRSIADAASILRYVKDTAAKHGIDSHVKYNHKVESMNWSTENQHWEVDVTVNGTEKRKFYSRFILLGTGYYDYTRGLNTQIPGIDQFKGTVVHPQFWPEELDYADKKVVIIGSGATAVTLLPAMADKAKHITMLQRSPSYFLPVPLTEPIDGMIKRFFPEKWAYQLIRLRFLLVGFFFFQFCRLFPKKGISVLREATEKELPKNIPFEPHFVPKYNPWEQRMCITPGKLDSMCRMASFA